MPRATKSKTSKTMFIVEEGEKVCVDVQTIDDRLRRASLPRVSESTQHRSSFARVHRVWGGVRTTFLGNARGIPLTIYFTDK